MHTFLKSRLEALQRTLNAAHSGGGGLPSAVLGAERELVLNGLLREVLPPIYRFGQGSIVDATGKATGQLDLVMELPFGPSFPAPLTNQRVYPAESIALVIEVKSDLYGQWDDAVTTCKAVKALTRVLQQREGLALESSPEPTPELSFTPSIPVYIIAFKGYKTPKGIQSKIEAVLPDARPDGVLVLSSGAFVGATGCGTGPEGIYRCIAEISERHNAALGLAFPSLLQYLR